MCTADAIDSGQPVALDLPEICVASAASLAAVNRLFCHRSLWITGPYPLELRERWPRPSPTEGGRSLTRRSAAAHKELRMVSFYKDERLYGLRAAALPAAAACRTHRLTSRTYVFYRGCMCVCFERISPSVKRCCMEYINEQFLVSVLVPVGGVLADGMVLFTIITMWVTYRLT